MSPAPRDPLVIYLLTGCSATGKKDVGFAAARQLGADVVSMDSVKVFRGLEIGAARPSAEERRGIDVYLMDQVEPSDAFSAGRYLAAAASAVQEIRGKRRLPLFLGGTPLYLRALLRGLFAGPPASPEIRARLREEADSAGVEALHRRLAEIDPQAARQILPRDFKRISRALEVYALTGRPISELQRLYTHPAIDGTFRVVGLRCGPDLARQRQEARVERMLERGLVEEVRGLLARGVLQGEAAKAIGYREIAAHLRGELSLAEAREEIVRATHRLVRKQEKWFRRFPEIAWVERTEGSGNAELVAQVVRLFQGE
ncbi:MAG: tRNA (adenosine(37)-N6)-dimethylallyltransferase MiaA [Planctomycetes bacterium]|nr:tRNA (adenosine(37)-N6)-dimethylallyltransferase MiaA [Planctomycetota bacterium]